MRRQFSGVSFRLHRASMMTSSATLSELRDRMTSRAPTLWDGLKRKFVWKRSQPAIAVTETQSRDLQKPPEVVSSGSRAPKCRRFVWHRFPTNIFADVSGTRARRLHSNVVEPTPLMTSSPSLPTTTRLTILKTNLRRARN